MKQSKSKKGREATAFLYERLSRDDNLDGDSYSIQNQKKLLTKVAKEKGYTNLVHFFDDGISGVTMDRPGFQSMLQEIEKGKAAAVFVKDLSRLGRNYIEVGRLTEEFFPEHDIRLVAVSDAIDTDEGENELAPIKNLFNEWYARDISKKRRISNKIKGNAGEPMGQPPYGYEKDPENPKRWIIEETAAAVVRRIYRMSLDGMGVEQIADTLSKEEILTPRFYWQAKGVRRAGNPPKYGPCHWNSSAVRKYTRAKKLTRRMLDELVQYIEVHQAEKINGAWVQRLTIHYNCIGAITIPEELTLPMPDITVNTRKGVYVSYQPDTKAG